MRDSARREGRAFTEVIMVDDGNDAGEQVARDLAAQFRRLRCRANEVIVQLGVLCERLPGEDDLRAMAAGLRTRHRCDLLTQCVNLEVGLQEARTWSGRVLAAVAAAQADAEFGAIDDEQARTGGER